MTKLLKLLTLAIPLLVGITSHAQFTILNQQPVSNRPYSVAYYNKQLPGAGAGGPLTHLMPNSANVVQTVMTNGTGTLVTGGGAWNSPGSDDGQHKPLYYGQSSNPVYAINSCTTIPSLNNVQFHAPSGAMFNQGSFDKEIEIWDQTNNRTVGLFGGTCTASICFALPTVPSSTCPTGTAASPCQVPVDGGFCSADNWVSGPGVGGGDAASTAGLSPFANIIRLTEIVNTGHINHGIRGVTTCNSTNSTDNNEAHGIYPSKTVYPATQLGGAPGQTCAGAGVASANRPPNGALFFLDYTTAQLNCFNPSLAACPGINKLATWQFMLIEAATLYGITIEDTGNGSSISLPGIESEQAYYFYETNGFPGAKAVAQQFETYMNNHCSGVSCNIITRSAPHSLIQWNINAWAGISLVNGGDVISHMHVADPCVAEGLQGVSGGCVSSNTPAANFSPNSLAFGVQSVSVPSTASPITLTNGGTATLTISSKLITGTNVSDFSETDNCPASLAAGSSCIFNVVFTPQASGARSATLSIANNAPGSPQQLSLTGTGGSLAVTINPLSLSFGVVPVGSCSAASTSTITNTGSTAVNLTSLTFTGTNPGDFPDGGIGSCPALIVPTARTYTTNFPLTENPISEGGAWTAGGTVGVNWGNPSTTPGKARGNENLSLAFGDSEATLQFTNWASNQRAFGTIFTNGTPTQSCGQEVEMRLRTTITPNSITGYEVSFSTAFGSLVIVRWNGPIGNFTVLGTVSGLVAHTGDVVKGTINGNVITAYINGNQQLQVTDSTYSSGFPGIGFNYSQNSGCTVGEQANYGLSSFTAEEITPSGGSGSLAPGASCTQSAKFCPTVAGARAASMNFVDNAPGSPQGVTLTGTGGTSAVGLSPASAACGSHQVGISSTCQAFTVTNTGNVTLSSIVVSLNGTNSSSFSQSNNCSATIAPAGTCAITVFFNPTTSGAQSANLAVASNSPNSPTLAALTGTGTLPAAITLAPQTVNFGSVLVGTTTPATSITLTNNGGTAVTISSIVATSPFGDTHNCPISPATLGAGLSCTINATATPTGSGVVNGTITVTDNAPGSPHVASLSVTGTAPTANISPITVSFGNQTIGTASSASTVVLTNQGTGPLTIASATISGANSGDFSKTTTCSSTVSPGASCTFSIVFNPAGAGARSATLSIATNAPGSPSTAALSGTGIATSPAVCLSPASVNFGNQSVGTSSGSRAVTVTNCGTASLVISGVTATGNFSRTTTCATVAPNATCTINGIFSPTSAGTLTGSFSITSNAASSPNLIPLSGFGTVTGATLTPTAAFGHVVVGVTSTGITLTLVNTGNTSLGINSPVLNGATPGDFSFVSNCSASLAANASCTYIVTFLPIATGARSAIFSQSFTGGGATVTSSLSGTGDATGSAVTFSPTAIDFGSVQTGVTSAAKTTQVNSVGTLALTIASITITGVNSADYAITSNTCGSTQPIGGFCTVSITITPGGTGIRTASLHLIDDAPNSPQDIPLTADGVATPAPQVSLPTSLNFSPPSIQTGFTSAAQVAPLVNTGNADLHVSSVTLGGTNPGDFTLSNNCGVVTAGNSCSATVNCKPTVAGARTATAIFASDAASSPDSVALSCTGFVGTPNIAIAVSTINFGNQIVGTVSSPVIFTLSNVGLATATGVTITAIGDFSVTDTCGGSIAVSGNCSATVTFSPVILCGQFGADGTTCITNVHTGQISVASNTSNSPQMVSLQGTAIPVPPPLGPVIVGMGGHMVVGGRIHVGVH